MTESKQWNLAELICGGCERTASDVHNLPAREQGDGSVVVSCPRCGSDLAVYEPRLPSGQNIPPIMTAGAN